jgi:hypothetical protein
MMKQEDYFNKPKKTMKKSASFARRFVLILCGVFLLTSAFVGEVRADLFPHLDCVEPVVENGVPTGEMRAYFGYLNTHDEPIYHNQGQNNFFSPNPGGRYSGLSPIYYQPGFHKRVFSIVFGGANGPAKVTWFLRNRPAATETNWGAFCSSGTMTYQGRLSVSGAAVANQPHDFQFQFYDMQTGGTTQGEVITMTSVPVVNGIFTVQLEIEHVFRNYTGKANFLEIRVRPSGSAGVYAPLSPRQPLSAVPLALNSKNSIRFDGKTADQFLQNSTAPQSNMSFNITGSGTIGTNLNVAGNLTANESANIGTNLNVGNNLNVNNNLIVNGTISSGCRTGFTPLLGGRLCVSALMPAANFYGANGAMHTCSNMQARVGTVADVTLTLNIPNFNYFGGAQTGWLGDYAGDNLRPVWNVSAPALDFDGAPVNVYNGGSNGTAPAFAFRCVY